MQKEILITLEILLVVVAPLIVLYLRGNWPLPSVVLALLIIPLGWYLTYAIVHELSHVVGLYLAGGKVLNYRLIPQFWIGEFGRAWITPSGITQNWQQLVFSASPYLLDIVCLIAVMFILQKGFSRNPFVVGFVFMFLCLRPAFDFVCEPIAFLTGDRGDFFAIQQMVGPFAIWSFILFSAGLSMISVLIILRRFNGFPKSLAADRLS